MYRIPVYQPSLDGNELRYVSDCIRSGWISSRGDYVQRFEHVFSDFVKCEGASAVCNGTVALHLALLALGVGPGDEVIVPTLTYVASVNAIRYVGGVPIFVDSAPDTWQATAEAVANAITPRTKAVLAVHLYGHPAPVDDYRVVCKRHGLFLIEDCAEAFGSYISGTHVGNFGDIATFSFFGNKTITTGEGGMVVSNDLKLLDVVNRLKNQGNVPDRRYWHDRVGFNYRMTNICAAIGLAQLERATDFLRRKKRIAELYRDLLAGTTLTFQRLRSGDESSNWMCSVLFPDADSKERALAALDQHGIETRPLFVPVHELPMYSSERRYPVAEDLSLRGINLPSWPGLRDEDIRFICEVIRPIVS